MREIRDRSPQCPGGVLPETPDSVLRCDSLPEAWRCTADGRTSWPPVTGRDSKCHLLLLSKRVSTYHCVRRSVLEIHVSYPTGPSVIKTYQLYQHNGQHLSASLPGPQNHKCWNTLRHPVYDVRMFLKEISSTGSCKFSGENFPCNLLNLAWQHLFKTEAKRYRREREGGRGRERERKGEREGERGGGEREEGGGDRQRQRA